MEGLDALELEASVVVSAAVDEDVEESEIEDDGDTEDMSNKVEEDAEVEEDGDAEVVSDVVDNESNVEEVEEEDEAEEVSVVDRKAVELDGDSVTAADKVEERLEFDVPLIGSKQLQAEVMRAA